MKINAIILVVFTIIFSAVQDIIAQNTIGKQDTTLIKVAEDIVYTCPMHQEIISEKKGTCPRCGMELVKVEKGKEQSNTKQHQMGMMMGPMHGTADMDHYNNPQKNNIKMMTGMGIGPNHTEKKICVFPCDSVANLILEK